MAANAKVKLDQAKLSVQVRKAEEHGLRPILLKIAREAKVIVSNKHNHPYSKTGRLARSISAGPIKGVNQYAVKGTVEATAPYAKFVHEGTRAHVIRARPGGKLRFVWTGRTRTEVKWVTRRNRSGINAPFATKVSVPDDDKTVVVDSVRHPGAKAKPFLRIAARRVTGKG